MDDDEWAKFNGWLDHVYDDFTTKAAQGRHLDLAKLRELAKGRVWSGVDAKQRGLVDELGGYETALRLAKQAAHLAPDADVEVREYPRQRNPFEEIFGEGRESSDEEGARAVERLAAALRPALRALREAGLLGQEAPQVLRTGELSVR